MSSHIAAFSRPKSVFEVQQISTWKVLDNSSSWCNFQHFIVVLAFSTTFPAGDRVEG